MFSISLHLSSLCIAPNSLSLSVPQAPSQALREQLMFVVPLSLSLHFPLPTPAPLQVVLLQIEMQQVKIQILVPL